MSDEIAIQVRGLGKKYTIGGPQEKYHTVRDAIANSVKAPFRRLSRQGADKSQNEFWALKDVTFDVHEGEVIGIIGRNGAGKSTLLKILSQITTPTEGEIDIYGRVGSLLEVGTGFHPELTGRENIFLSGSILGMRKREIEAKLDDIVKFSEIEKFLDTPVKRYSSGMYVRLAFAVAAHMDTEILLVDEVLAVGDAGFQKKCLGKMGEVAKEGRTVLFVSHNMAVIEKLCHRCILLSEGKLFKDSDNVRSTVLEYENSTTYQEKGLSIWEKPNNHSSNPWFDLQKMYVGDVNGNPLTLLQKNDSDFWIYLKGQVKETSNSLSVGYALFEKDTHICVFWTLFTDDSEGFWPKIDEGETILRSKFPKNLVNEGTYRLDCIAGLHNQKHIYQSNVNSAFIELTIKGGLSDSPYWIGKRPGIVAPILKWERFTKSKEEIK